ncbi:MAG: hypothetical protein OXE94_00710 [Aestuariivita sp.]|nr:hypothetical protein [Aestuariivita sp.]MCY4202639.1 hypothetical protein [Aestuariivita sp.]
MYPRQATATRPFAGTADHDDSAVRGFGWRPRGVPPVKTTVTTRNSEALGGTRILNESITAIQTYQKYLDSRE